MSKYSISCDFVKIKKDVDLYVIEQYLQMSFEDYILDFDEVFKIYCQKIETSKLFQRNKLEGFFYSLHKLSTKENEFVDEILQDSLENYINALNKYF